MKRVVGIRTDARTSLADVGGKRDLLERDATDADASLVDRETSRFPIHPSPGTWISAAPTARERWSVGAPCSETLIRPTLPVE